MGMIKLAYQKINLESGGLILQLQPIIVCSGTRKDEDAHQSDDGPMMGRCKAEKRPWPGQTTEMMGQTERQAARQQGSKAGKAFMIRYAKGTGKCIAAVPRT
jgi:hypothetical protein